MKILHPDQSASVSVYGGKKRILVSIEKNPSIFLFFPLLFMLPMPVLSGDSEVLKMLNAHCFHADNTFMFYFLKLFLLAVKHGLVLCCIQLASHRQRRRSSTGQTKKLNRSFHGWGRCAADLLHGICKFLLAWGWGRWWGWWCNAKHKK